MIDLENLYKSTLEDLGLNTNTVDLAIGHAHLQAFYLDKADSAIQLLKTAIALRGARRSDVAEAKIELGDIYIIQNEIWEASLLFSQVVGDFKYDELGEIREI